MNFDKYPSPKKMKSKWWENNQDGPIKLGKGTVEWVGNTMSSEELDKYKDDHAPLYLIIIIVVFIFIGVSGYLLLDDIRIKFDKTAISEMNGYNLNKNLI